MWEYPPGDSGSYHSDGGVMNDGQTGNYGSRYAPRALQARVTGHNLSNPQRRLQIRMVAGCSEVTDQKEFGCTGPIRTEYIIFEHTVPQRLL